MFRPYVLGLCCAITALGMAGRSTLAACPGGGNCNGHGTCIVGSDTCICSAGFTGNACQYSAATTCNNHGTPIFDGSCICSAGYTGANCQTCATNYYNYPTCTFCTAALTCNGHGTCTTSGSCSCATGFTGANCNQCAEGYYGPNCLPCPGGGGASQCSAHGTCNDGPSGTGSCACNVGFVGTACQYSNATTCNGHGTVNGDGSCTCATGYAGDHCDTCDANYYNYPTCTFCGPVSCNAHGSCSATGTCDCFPGFAGATCNTCAPNYFNYPVCTFCNAASTCTGHGVCTGGGSCACFTGYTGANCAACAPNYYNFPACTFCDAGTTCNGHGFCSSGGTCICLTGWTGPNCTLSTAPAILSWQSVRTHEGEGALSIPIDPTATGNGAAGPTVEPRAAGIQMIRMTLDHPATFANAAGVSVIGRTTSNGSLGSPMSYLPVVIAMPNALTLEIGFVPGQLPDQTCYTITIGAATFIEGIAGDNTANVRALVGDVTGNGIVTLSDALLTGVRVAAGVTSFTSPASDLNLSGGNITVADVLAAKARVASPALKTLCP